MLLGRKPLILLLLRCTNAKGLLGRLPIAPQPPTATTDFGKELAVPGRFEERVLPGICNAARANRALRWFCARPTARPQKSKLPGRFRAAISPSAKFFEEARKKKEIDLAAVPI